MFRRMELIYLKRIRWVGNCRKRPIKRTTNDDISKRLLERQRRCRRSPIKKSICRIIAERQTLLGSVEQKHGIDENKFPRVAGHPVTRGRNVASRRITTKK